MLLQPEEAKEIKAKNQNEIRLKLMQKLSMNRLMDPIGASR
jgi:hypothetical protein